MDGSDGWMARWQGGSMRSRGGLLVGEKQRGVGWREAEGTGVGLSAVLCCAVLGGGCLEAAADLGT